MKSDSLHKDFLNLHTKCYILKVTILEYVFNLIEKVMNSKSEKYTAYSENGIPEIRPYEWISVYDHIPTDEDRQNYKIVWKGNRPENIADVYGTSWAKIARDV